MIIGFKWYLENKLAGSAMPGLYKDIDDDMSFLKSIGITMIVSLTEDCLELKANDDKIEIVHCPVADMGIPLPKNAHLFCEKILAEMEVGKVLVHCKAGMGRTGTIIACILVAMGNLPNKAISIVRTVNKGAIQNDLQEGFVTHFYQYLLTQNHHSHG